MTQQTSIQPGDEADGDATAPVAAPAVAAPEAPEAVAAATAEADAQADPDAWAQTIVAMRNAHRTLLACCEAAAPGPTGTLPVCVGESLAMCAHADERYWALRILHHAMTNPATAAGFKEAMNAVATKPPFSDDAQFVMMAYGSLLTPIQRWPRYQLLLGELVKRGADAGPLKERVKATCDRLNELEAWFPS